MKFIGIDPGKTGGMGTLDEKGKIIDFDIMRDFDEFIKFLEDMGDDSFCFIEKAQALPGNSALSMFNYGQHFGELVGALRILKRPFEMVPPQTWTKVMHIGAIGDRPKDKSRSILPRLFPDIDLSNPDLSPVRRGIKRAHEGIMDALLIAEYGRRKWIKG